MYFKWLKQRFAAVYGAELSFSSNDYRSLVTWKMLLSRGLVRYA